MQDEAQEGYQLSLQQERAWLLGNEAPGYRVQCAVAIDGPLDVPALWRALDVVVERHEALRTTYRRVAGLRVPLQYVSDALEPAKDEVAGATDGDIRTLMADAGRLPLDAEAGPVLRATLVSIHDQSHVLVLTALPVAVDPASLVIVATELARAYSDPVPATSGEAPLQYVDFVGWQHETLTSDEDAAGQARSYWTGWGDDRPAGAVLPFERTPTAGASPLPNHVPVAVGAETLARLEDVARNYGTDLAGVVEAAWYCLVGRLSGAEELAMAAVTEGRHHDELEGAVGAYTRALPLRVAIGDDPSFAEVLDRARRSRADAERWQDWFPREGVTPPHAFWAWQAGPAVTEGGVTFSVADLSAPVAELRCALEWRSDDSSVRLHFDAAALTCEVAEQMASQLASLLGGVADDPSAAVSRLPLLTAAERRRLVVDLNATVADFPADACIHHLFEAQAARHPDRVAVVAPDGDLSYGELDRRANQLAHLLRGHGVGPDVPVGICLHRSAQSMVALLGVLKAGGAYLPLNLDHPPARLAHQLGEAQARAVVTEEGLLDRLAQFDRPTVCVDRDAAVLAAEPDAPVAGGAGPESLAYVMYTSGSTGLPKGAMVTHRNLVNYASFITTELGATVAEGLTFAAVSEISTDLGNTTLFPSLISGGRLHLVPAGVALDGALYADYSAEAGIDVLKITPSHLAALMTAEDAGAVLPRHTLLIGGEILPWDLVTRVKAAGRCRVLNHYGPTETCVGSTTFDTGADVSAWSPTSVPIGRPIANARAYILDRHLEPTPLGVAGDLFIGGAGVSRGYCNRPEATTTAFLADPFVGGDARLYRTGDRARFLGDGSIEFLGRQDGQVKIRGYRVETAEVEATLRKHANVQQAAVVVREDVPGDRRLVAYIVSEFLPEPTDEQLRGFLADYLPSHMVPAAVVSLDALPLTPNGKLDRAALPQPEETAAGRRQFVAPRNETEQAVAGVWEELLGLEQVGADDDFFELGGHSLLATQVIARLRKAFDVQLAVHALFTSPTVAGLAEVVDESRRAAGEAEDAQLARLLEELESLSDEEAERLLAAELGQTETDP